MDLSSSPGRDAAPSTASGAAASPAKALRILLVDDDALVRCGTADMLSYSGHKVFEAASGTAALEILGRGEEIDLLITDNRMPGMTGEALIARVRQDRPGLPILLVTGYASRGEGIGPDVGLLAKPFREAELLSAVRAVSGRAESAR